MKLRKSLTTAYDIIVERVLEHLDRYTINLKQQALDCCDIDLDSDKDPFDQIISMSLTTLSAWSIIISVDFVIEKIQRG
ncbi:hypothetical protein MAM1_0029c02298 [Mucor ambiguus]|uniref:Uncharacterized protein n=1 Tax=Mucor ambiguus TaxID=91626 RepID=A0A0C9LSJ5_9FUNG|nr:hypothetical protein MAM1_0029c02298 [Mucor ambiguus]